MRIAICCDMRKAYHPLSVAGAAAAVPASWAYHPRMASERIVELLRSAPLIDGHNDLVWALRKAAEKGESHDVGSSAPSLHTDLPRLERGGVRGQFWSVYVPSDLADPHAAGR